MCRYEYARYGACDHSVIECREVCGVTLWRAGLTGDLILCVPSIVGRPIQQSGPKETEILQFTKFVGFAGSCNACIKELNIQGNIRLHDDQSDYITISEGQLSPDTVFYFQVEQLLTTFPHLLAIDQQLIQANMDLGPAVLFPEAIVKLTWEVLRTQQPYKVSGFWTTQPLGELLNELQCPSGLSLQDREMFVRVLQNNLDMNQFYKDVFMSRGMPYSLFSRVCAQIRHKVNTALQNVNLGVAGGNRAQQSAVNTSLQHPGNSDQSTSDAQGSKRSFSSMQEGMLENAGSSINTQQSHHNQDNYGRPAQRPRHSQPVAPSSLNHGTYQVQSATAVSSQQLAMNTAGVPGARSTVSPSIPPSGHLTPMPQQPLGGQRPLGQFDIAACRAMQVQARAAQAIPLQPLSAAVVQSQAALLQAAQARAAQPQPLQSQAQLVDPTRAQFLQAQYRQSHAPSEMAGNQARASQFSSAFDHTVESSGMVVAAARAGIRLTVKEAEKLKKQADRMAQEEAAQMTQEETQRAQDDESHASSHPTSQAPLDPSLVDPALMDQSVVIQSPAMAIQSPQNLSATPTATPSPSSQQPTLAKTESSQKKPKRVLPHTVAKATFYLNDKERDLAVANITGAWNEYRRCLDGSADKRRAGFWLVNFSLNFEKEYDLYQESRGTLKNVTMAQLKKPTWVVRLYNRNKPAPSAGAGSSQTQQGSSVGDNQTPQYESTMGSPQGLDHDYSWAASSDSQLHDPVSSEGPMIPGSNSDASDSIGVESSTTPSSSGV